MHQEGTVVTTNYIHSTPRGGADPIMRRLTEETNDESILRRAIREALVATMGFDRETYHIHSFMGTEGRMTAGGGIPYSIIVEVAVPADQFYMVNGTPSEVAVGFRNHLVNNLRAVFREWPDESFEGIPLDYNIYVAFDVAQRGVATHPSNDGGGD